MKINNSYFYTLRENPKDEDSTSASLLTRSGMIKRTSSGVYMFLPLGFKVLKNIENIIRDEMNKTGAQELLAPALILEEVYEKSGRRESFGSNMFSLKDRFNKNYVLGPTHEELFAMAGTMKVKSYKDLPFNLYQFQTKFRDETRPRYGLIRVREFIMKDAYSFDTDSEGLEKSYRLMETAYHKAFDRMNLNYRVVTADTGAMGGLLSEEFQAITPIGEDTIVLCHSCDLSTNIEITKCVNTKKSNELILTKELIETPNAKTIKEVSELLNEVPSKFVKTLIYKIKNEIYAILIKGDDDVNETKLSKVLNTTDIEMADQETVEKLTKAKVGFAGPIDLPIKIIMDNEVLHMVNFIVGANKTNYHYKNVNLTDFKYEQTADLRFIKENDICPKCGGKVYFTKGIEIGNLFKLGTKYAEALNLNYLDKENNLNPVMMGSYGIGPARCMAAIVEQSNDENGIIWPLSIAPYKVGIIIVNTNDEVQMEVASNLYDELTKLNIDVILDDREERVGVKFNDMDLIGIPLRLTVGKKTAENLVELKLRQDQTSIDIEIKEVLTKIRDILE